MWALTCSGFMSPKSACSPSAKGRVSERTGAAYQAIEPSSREGKLSCSKASSRAGRAMVSSVNNTTRIRPPMMPIVIKLFVGEFLEDRFSRTLAIGRDKEHLYTNNKIDTERDSGAPKALRSSRDDKKRRICAL